MAMPERGGSLSPRSGIGTSVASGSGRVFVVTNDQMRDHHFQMLNPRNFIKWRERHQVAFHFQEYGGHPVGRRGEAAQPLQRHLHFRFPSIFSHRLQPAADGQAWYFPVGGTSSLWFCAWL